MTTGRPPEGTKRWLFLKNQGTVTREQKFQRCSRDSREAGNDETAREIVIFTKSQFIVHSIIFPSYLIDVFQDELCFKFFIVKLQEESFEV
jgi:hypothetical protein